MADDANDFVRRISAMLPKRWFGDSTPNLNAILASLATPWAWLSGSLEYVALQTRVSTATDDWLDLISYDYFGDRLKRNLNEPDNNFRSRIQVALLGDAVTRSAIFGRLQELLDTPPIIFEPSFPRDTGAYTSSSEESLYSSSGLAYGTVGGWGSLTLPFQAFITVNRAPVSSRGTLTGYSTSNGGYGTGSSSYTDLADLPGRVTDQDIQAAIVDHLPVNTTAWLRII